MPFTVFFASEANQHTKITLERMFTSQIDKTAVISSGIEEALHLVYTLENPTEEEVMVALEKKPVDHFVMTLWISLSEGSKVDYIIKQVGLLAEKKGVIVIQSPITALEDCSLLLMSTLSNARALDQFKDSPL